MFYIDILYQHYLVKFLPKYIFFVCLIINVPKKIQSIFSPYFLVVKDYFFLIPFISTPISQYNMHVYDISPIFMTNYKMFLIEYKSYILLLQFLESDIFRQILWLIYKFIPKYMFFCSLYYQYTKKICNLNLLSLFLFYYVMSKIYLPCLSTMKNRIYKNKN